MYKMCPLLQHVPSQQKPLNLKKYFKMFLLGLCARQQIDNVSHVSNFSLNKYTKCRMALRHLPSEKHMHHLL